MPPALPADQELDLKRRARRRLIGAVALALLMVLILPRLLEHQPKTIGTEIPIRIGEAGATAAEASNETATTSAANAAAEAAESAPSADTAPAPEPQPAPAPETPSRRDTAPSPSAASDTPATRSEPQRSESSREGNFVVQVGAFSNAQKAQRVQDKLAAASIPAFTEKVDVSGETRIRVRAGPFMARRQAEAVLPKLKDLGLDGQVMQR